MFTKPLIIGIHAGIVVTALLLAFVLRFDFSIPSSDVMELWWALAIFLPLKMAVFQFTGIHRASWRRIDIFDVLKLILANQLAAVCCCIVTLLIVGRTFPRSVYVLDLLLCSFLIVAAHASLRVYTELIVARLRHKTGKPLLIYGAGAAGLALGKEVHSNSKLDYRLIGFLDDAARKRGTSLLGVPVLGCGREAPRIVARARERGLDIAEIIIAIPSATGREMREVTAHCRAAGVPFKTIPGLGEFLNGNILSNQIRDVSVCDLLGREPVHLDETLIRQNITGKVTMITGACGSIGSELCRQVARFDPKMLVIFDQSESALFMFNRELSVKFPGIKLQPVIGDIRCPSRVEEVIARYRVQIIFHAAAYKHVPMMEDAPLEAVENNIIGTYNVVQAAHVLGVEKFVMISSDKAVNPSSIMGLTKRVAELIVSRMPLGSESRKLCCVSVRFGNVLGSSGSVVPIFQQQIAAGGPVTVMHPEMRRYFMTIPEAAQLVLQASAIGNGSEVFVLDMGEPVYIADLARSMIRLAGREPDKDIEIRYIGVRPGEKLFEELTIHGEDFLDTKHQKIKVLRTQAPPRTVLHEWFENLNELLESRNEAAVLSHLKRLVPEYRNDMASFSEERVRSQAATMR